MSITMRTQRLLLRSLELNDSHSFFSYRSLDEVSAFQSFKPQVIHDAEKFITLLSKEPNIPGTWFQIAVCLLLSQCLIGDIGIHFLTNTHQVEIGYTLAPAFQGKGYAFEAVSRVLDYLFFELRKHKVIASVDPSNKNSIRLLERLTFKKETLIRKSNKKNNMCLDDCVYVLLKEEWDSSFIEG